ncbi:uncharacterized protein KIAA0825 homolog isoform X2 [Hyperolius riggenbachi]|uniref:uncharacterized protein KIAA0825 homolog isoform X2 n=1 Tax=Hyperolius riggenbachi TaxID=752182 RepID=UPI0035A2E5AD
MAFAGEDQLSFAMLDCVLDMFPGHLECQQILADIDEKLKVNSESIEECLETLRLEVNEKYGEEVLQSNEDCVQWLKNPPVSRILADTPHNEVMTFLKTLQHFLKNNKDQEDMVLQLLVALSRKCGVTFPSSATGGSFQCTSQTSLHATDDECSMDLQTAWDDVRLHLRRHLLGILQASSDISTSQSRIQVQRLQSLFFLYPGSDTLVKYQKIQQNFVIEILHKYSERMIENVLGTYQTAIPKVLALIKEDMSVLSHVIDSPLIIKFINETFFEAITEEMKTFFEILCKTSTVEQPLQPSRITRKKHKQRVHALATNIEDHRTKAKDGTLQLNQLKALSKFINLFLWLEGEVEKASLEILPCYPDAMANVHGILKTDSNEGKMNEGSSADEGSLLMKEMPTLKFEWRETLKEISQRLALDLPHVMEEVTANAIHSNTEEFSATEGSTMSLVSIAESYKHYGAIPEQQRPKQVAKFCFDIVEEFDLLFPLAMACRGDSLQNIKACFTEAFSKAVMLILRRLQEWSKQLPEKTPVRTALASLSSAVHVLHHLTHYNELLSKRPLFTAAVQRYQEFISSLQIQVTNYCVNVCATSLLQDAESHHWDDNKAFYEGERCSFSIQMWHYFCRGLCHDLWTTVSPVHAQTMLSEVLKQTLALLTFRYSQVHPNYKRASQIRTDVLAILCCVEDMLWSVCGTLQAFVQPTQSPQDVIFMIHSYCDSLLTVMTILTSPLELLTSTIKNMFSERHDHSSETSETEDLLWWLKFINPKLFPSSSRTPSAGEMADQGQLKLLLSQPCSNWNLLLQTLLHPDCLIARTLLTGSINKTEPLESSDYEFIMMEANHEKDTDLTQVILSVFCYCSHSPRSLTILLEQYMDQEQLWECLCDQTAHSSSNAVIRYLRRVLIRSLRGMVNEVTSVLNSFEQSNDSSPGSYHCNVPDVLLSALPEKWHFSDLHREETSHSVKDSTRLTAKAVSIVINKLPSVIACLPPAIKYFFLFSERKLAHQNSVLQNTGVLVWNLIEVVCRTLKDGNAVEQLTRTTLTTWSQERLAVVCGCLEKISGIKASHSKDSEAQRVLEDIERSKPKWIKDQLLRARTLSRDGDFAMQEDSSIGKVQGSRLDLTEQKINMMVLDICHKPGGSEYLRQIHHIIQLNEVYLNEALTSQPCEQADKRSRAFQLTLTSEDDHRSSFNPLHAFTLPGLSVLSESATMDEGWDWSALLPHCLQVNPVTLGELLQHRSNNGLRKRIGRTARDLQA